MAHPKTEEVRELCADGLTNTAIGKQLRMERQTVGRIRRELGIPNVPRQPLTLEEKWAAFTRPLDGGHLEWTGETQSTSGTPVMRYKEESYSPAAIAFTIKYGRQPQGYVKAECDVKHCVAPAHVEDEAGRLRVREQLRYLTGRLERPATCRHGHDQSVHGRYETDGRAYCEACKASRRPQLRDGPAGA